jgi:putative phosphoesterase
MRIALLGDVHANLPALEAVLSHAQQNNAEQIWNTGDFVGYGAFPNEVIEMLRHAGTISISGNYDLKVVHFPKKKLKWRKSKMTEKYTAFKWAFKNLKPKNRRYLAKLPTQIRLEIEGRRFLITHGSPASEEEHLTLDTPWARLKELSELSQADVIVCGHSHQPFARLVDRTWFINTGSVGRPGDGDPRACYGILDISPSHFWVRHYRIEYDIPRAAAAVRQQGLPEAFAQMILQGYDLEIVLEEPDNLG